MLAGTMTSRGTAAPVHSPPVILLVEDEELVRLSAAEYLRFSDFHVLEAANADEALAILTSNTHVDLVFSDVRMPGRLDGFDLAQWLMTHRPALPVLLTSGYAGLMRDANRSLPVLPKPYSLETLLGRINELLPPALLTGYTHRPND
ncbi:MAG: response regulator [Proteobacteria bacterium]|nr:response regulator [Pseudomonadota bacterium]